MEGKEVREIEIGDRIKELRQMLHLTQQEFSDRISVKRSTIAQYEIGRNVPADSVIALICREYGVSEAWLRTGEGDMFVPQAETLVDQLAEKYHLTPPVRLLVEKFVLLPEDGYSPPPKALPAKLSPSAQLVLLWLLQSPDGGDWTEFGTLRKKLIPNRVYLTLAVQDLERRDLVQTRRNGLRKSIRPAGSRRAVWEMARESLSSPVLRTRRLAKAPPGLPVAGLTALARLSSINDEPPRCVATFRGNLAAEAAAERHYDGEVVQEWKYDPLLLSPDGRTVDPLSLFLSLRNETDPRVRSALEECLEAMQW